MPTDSRHLPIPDEESQIQRKGIQPPGRRLRTKYNFYPAKLTISDKEVEASVATDDELRQLQNTKKMIKGMIALALVMIAVTAGLYIYKTHALAPSEADSHSNYTNGLPPAARNDTESDVAEFFSEDESIQDEKDPQAEKPSPATFVPTNIATESYLESSVLGPNEKLVRGQFVTSPSGNYQLGLQTDGNFVLRETKTQLFIWSTGTVGASRCFMQSDGNLIIRDGFGKSLWSSKTFNHPGAELIVDDGGRIGVVHESTFLWTQGIPRGKYTGPSSPDLTFPVRGAFYYPWYPATWTVNSQFAHFKPDIGYYSSGDPKVVENHIDAFDYANTDLGIISWWGPSTNQDRSRITLLMDQTLKMKSDVKWSIYYEDEMDEDPSISKIKKDLAYLKKWFAWHPTFAHVNGKPVIFLYNNSGCDQVKRWMEAANGEWHVVPKLFVGFESCANQPSSWHQYGPGNAVLQYEGHSFSISPGFYKADEPQPRLPRLSKSEWCQNVQSMVDSKEPWQLITTFNEAGEGTLIEASSANWFSASGYGYYLDCLHDIA